MHPIICTIGPFTVYSYGLMVALGFFTGSYLAKYVLGRKLESRRFTVNAEEPLALRPEAVFTFCFILLICGIAGARIFYVLENPGFYLNNPAEIIMLQKGGLSWFGGLASSLIAAIWYLTKNKLPVIGTLDFFAPFVALGQAFGRIGCLFQGCCYGRPDEHGIYFAVYQQTLVPVQVYSSVSLLGIYLILRFLQERRHRRADIFYAYLLLYSLKRFLIEFLRIDNPFVYGSLTLFHFISAGVFIFAVWRLFWHRHNRPLVGG